MNTNTETSVRFTLDELKRIERDRVAEEREAQLAQLREVEADKLRRAEAAAEAVRAAERVLEAERARAEAERVTRELTEKVARIQAEAQIERERLAHDRARLEATVAAAPAPPAKRGALWAALALSLATMIGSTVWLDARIGDERARAQRAQAGLQADLEARLDAATARADQAMRAAEDAAAAAARTPAPIAPQPTAATPKPTATAKPPKRTPEPAATEPGGKPIRPVDSAAPLGGLRH